ncbi:MAG TPA: amidohydrolase family protein [Anaeromyxobacteraceae bacterium]
MGAPRPGAVGRTWASLAGIAAAAVGLALAAGAAVEGLRPDLARLPGPEFRALAIPRVDADQRFGPAVADYAVHLSRSFGAGRIANLAGGFAGDGLEGQLAAAAKHQGRLRVLMNLDPAGCCGGAWAERERARLAAGRAAGAAGLHLGADLPAEAAPGAAGLEPILDACEALGLPVSAEVSGDEGREALARLSVRRPRLGLLASDLAGLAADPPAAAALLTRAPGLHLGLGARLAELARRPEAARAFLLAHADRVLHGTGTRYLDVPPYHELVLGDGPPARGEGEVLRFHLGNLRLLETRDRAIPSPVPTRAPGELRGLGLPRATLERIYHRNAERVLGFPPERP